MDFLRPETQYFSTHSFFTEEAVLSYTPTNLAEISIAYPFNISGYTVDLTIAFLTFSIICLAVFYKYPPLNEWLV